MAEIEAYKKLVSDYSHAVDFIIIYINEAHPIGEWSFDGDKHKWTQAKNVDDRVAGAGVLNEHEIGCEITIDTMDNQAALLYGAWPERLFVIHDGIVVYDGGQGPPGYDVKAVGDFVKKYVKSL